jgi:hypothetical protein
MANESFEAQMRGIVSRTLSLGITKAAIAERAGYERSAFIKWTNDPTKNLTLSSADSIRRACLELARAKTGGGQ